VTRDSDALRFLAANSSCFFLSGKLCQRVLPHVSNTTSTLLCNTFVLVIELHSKCCLWNRRYEFSHLQYLCCGLIGLWVLCMKGRDSSVGIATGYGLDGPGIESQWGRAFSHTSRPAPGAHPSSSTMGTGSFPEVKRPGRGVDHPPPSSAEVTNE
jgi:hypothetical protein